MDIYSATAMFVNDPFTWELIAFLAQLAHSDTERRRRNVDCPYSMERHITVQAIPVYAEGGRLLRWDLPMGVPFAKDAVQPGRLALLLSPAAHKFLKKCRTYSIRPGVPEKAPHNPKGLYFDDFCLPALTPPETAQLLAALQRELAGKFPDTHIGITMEQPPVTPG